MYRSKYRYKYMCMLWLKRILCGLVSLLMFIVGFMLIDSDYQAIKALAFCFLILGLVLSYIAIVQKLPNYSFWITIIALGLSCALIELKLFDKQAQENKPTNVVEKTIDTSVEKNKDEIKHNEDLKSKDATLNTESKEQTRLAKHKKARSDFDYSKYPKVSGMIRVIHANILQIGGRYVRLYGLDAPDNDQVCSDVTGSSYNCGQEAVSWLRSWIDDNPIDCYLLEINPNGVDVATCVWGEYDIGAGLVASGWAVANTNETNIYKPYEIKARSNSSGLWQGTFYSPSDWRKIKSEKNNFTIKRRAKIGGGISSFFKSLF